MPILERMAQPGDDWPPLAVDVPDDARELDRDVAAYRRELRSHRRRDRIRRIFLVDRWRRYGPAGPVGIAVLVLVAAAGSLLALLVPSTQSSPERLPLATPSTPIGAVGGLVPDVELHLAGGGTTLAPSLRPAVLAVVRHGCDCADVIEHLADQAGAYRLPVAVIVQGRHDADLEQMAQSVHGGAAYVAYDPGGQLVAQYADPTSPVTAVLVHADGVVGDVLPVDPDTKLLGKLVQLSQPGGQAEAHAGPAQTAG